MSSKPIVFLSYAREDQRVVEGLYRLLSSKGFRPWMDVKDISPGEDWQLSIKRAIRRSNFFLTCVSQHSITKAGVLQEELRSALLIREENLEGEKYLIPVRLDQTGLPEALRRYQCVDYFEAGGKKRLLTGLGYRGRVWLWVLAAVLLIGVAVFVYWLSRPSPDQRFVAARPGGDPSLVSNATTFVGLTLWQLRPSKNSDPPGVRMIVHPKETSTGPAEWTPERLPAALMLTSGMKFRLGIESTTSGYLYVIDQEQYSQGRVGQPNLIFPTIRIREGNNRIQSGDLIELPSQHAKPPYWEFRVPGPDYPGELLTILITPAPMPSLKPAEESYPIAQEQMAEWLRKWRVGARKVFDQPGSALPTQPEIDARNQPAHHLGPEDALPGAIFSAGAKAGVPFLIQVPLTVTKE